MTIYFKSIGTLVASTMVSSLVVQLMPAYFPPAVAAQSIALGVLQGASALARYCYRPEPYRQNTPKLAFDTLLMNAGVGLCFYVFSSYVLRSNSVSAKGIGLLTLISTSTFVAINRDSKL
ncbi:MAG: hypothetical protein JSS10_09685 [Verrucomicrobia bacterium]|nr:hypothetical protein [Verrucomicrobiota bacterium]